MQRFDDPTIRTAPTANPFRLNPRKQKSQFGKNEDPFAESGCRAFDVLLFVTVNSSIAELRSAKPFPLQLILSVRFPDGEKVCPTGEKYTSWRLVT